LLLIIITVAAQRFVSPAAGDGNATKPENYFAAKKPPRTHAEGGQVEPVLGVSCFSSLTYYKLPL